LQFKETVEICQENYPISFNGRRNIFGTDHRKGEGGANK